MRLSSSGCRWVHQAPSRGASDLLAESSSVWTDSEREADSRAGAAGEGGGGAAGGAPVTPAGRIKGGAVGAGGGGPGGMVRTGGGALGGGGGGGAPIPAGRGGVAV